MSGDIQLPTTGTFSGLTEQGYINTALADLAVDHQGGTAPTTTSTGLSSLAGLFWHDTTNFLLKIRDQADSTWITRGALDETGKKFHPYSIGVVGEARNLKVVRSSATVLSITADEIIVSVGLGGQCFRIANFSQTLTITNVGIGGNDVAIGTPGAVDYSVYAAFDLATGGVGVFGCLGSVSNGSCYSGANAPSGYTATALVSSLKLNSSSQFASFSQMGRRVSMSNGAVSGLTNTSWTGVSISAQVPANAKRVSGYMTVSGTGAFLLVAADSNGNGANQAYPSDIGDWDVDLPTAQTVYYQVGGTSPSGTITPTRYEF